MDTKYKKAEKMKKFLIINLFVLSILGFVLSDNIAAENMPANFNIEYMEFREVDIKDVLRQLAKQYSLNIVFSESVKGLVTVQLNNVSIDQALDSIITVNGFAYTKKQNVYQVTTQQEAQMEGRQTKLFKLNNADAMKLKDTLSKMLSGNGSIEADGRSNSLVVTDSLSIINKIETMIPALDELTPQVLIEAKIIETSLTNTEKLGIDWETTIRASGSQRPHTFPFKNWGSEQDYYPTPEHSTTNTTVTSDFAFGPNGFASFPMAAAEEFTFGTLDFSTVTAMFDFLKSRVDTKLIASPRIMTTNNQKATINVGKVIPIALYEQNENTGNWEVTGWEEQNVGINLQVIPQISPDGHIKLRLKPEVSNIIDYIGEDVNQRPITSTRTAETEVQIRDGQTVVIGGLVKTKDAKTETRVPFLSNIPLLGRLFTRNETGSAEEPDEKTDLLIFVTAHIVKDGESPPVGSTSSDIGSDIMASNRPFKLEKR